MKDLTYEVMSDPSEESLSERFESTSSWLMISFWPVNNPDSCMVESSLDCCCESSLLAALYPAEVASAGSSMSISEC